MRVQNWDDLRYVAVVARHGSLAEASRLLGVDRSTVQRRIKALEAQLGYRLFVKNGSGYTALAEAEPIIAAARSIEAAMNGPVPRPEEGSRGVSGTLSVTTTDAVYLGGLSGMVDSFQTRHPALRIDLNVTTRKVALGQLEADVAIRPSDSPPDHFVGRRVCDLSFGVYASPDYLAANPAKTRQDHNWLTVGEALHSSAPGRWVDENIPPDRRILCADTFIALAEACRLSRGVALLPNCYAARLKELTPVEYLMDAPLTTGLWLLTHADLRDLPRVRLFLDFMWKEMSRAKKHFAG
ncbi:MAG: LysR family transcriptional regulator [Hyphomonas sp.]